MRHGLEHARHGESGWPESHGHQAHLAHVWVAAPSERGVQAVDRSAARRESPRYCGAPSGSPPPHAAVFCVDEKPEIPVLDRTQPLLPMRRGQVERHTHDDTRHGTTKLFAALNAKTSEVIA